jgi:hypothetical protein
MQPDRSITPVSEKQTLRGKSERPEVMFGLKFMGVWDLGYTGFE